MIWQAKALGIVSDLGENTFSPDVLITRQDMFEMMYKAMIICGMIEPISNTEVAKSFEKFTDNEDIASYARKAMGTFINNGIISGKGDGILDPQGTSTRAEAAQTLYNVLIRDKGMN